MAVGSASGRGTTITTRVILRRRRAMWDGAVGAGWGPCRGKAAWVDLIALRSTVRGLTSHRLVYRWGFPAAGPQTKPEVVSSRLVTAEGGASVLAEVLPLRVRGSTSVTTEPRPAEVYHCGRRRRSWPRYWRRSCFCGCMGRRRLRLSGDLLMSRVNVVVLYAFLFLFVIHPRPRLLRGPQWPQISVLGL